METYINNIRQQIQELTIMRNQFANQAMLWGKNLERVYPLERKIIALDKAIELMKAELQNK